jgi:ABC-type molybdate transport system substrate-binding protein
MPDPDQTVSGRAGQAALEKRKLWTLVKAKTQLTPNENASLDLIKRNQVEATIMGYSNVSNLKIPGWQVYDVDPADYPALNYQAVVAANSPRKNAAQAFQRFMTSAEAKPVWEKYGFWAPQ